MVVRKSCCQSGRERGRQPVEEGLLFCIRQAHERISRNTWIQTAEDRDCPAISSFRNDGVKLFRFWRLHGYTRHYTLSRRPLVDIATERGLRPATTYLLPSSQSVAGVTSFAYTRC